MSSVTETRLTAHAALVMRLRGIALEWVEDTLRFPSKVRADTRDGNLTLAFRRVPEADDKWLRVVYRMENHRTHVVITAFFDRNEE